MTYNFLPTQKLWFEQNLHQLITLRGFPHYDGCDKCQKNSCYYCDKEKQTVKHYMKLRTIKKHRAKYEPVMNAIKRYNHLNLLKRKYDKVLYELQLVPPMKSGLFSGGILYNISKDSFEQNNLSHENTQFIKPSNN